MKILANENIPLSSVRYLIQQGFDIIHVGDDFSGITDVEVIELAEKENRLIITLDRDYGELIFKKGLQPPAGVIYLRFQEYTPDMPGQLIKELLSDKSLQFHNRLTVVDNKSLRQRFYRKDQI